MENQMLNSPETQIAQLKNRIAQLESEVRTLRAYGSNVSNLQSPNFMKRAFAVWGHHFIAQFIISLILGIIGFCISIALGGSLLAVVESMLNY